MTDTTNKIHTLTAEVERLRAENAELASLCAEALAEIERISGRVVEAAKPDYYLWQKLNKFRPGDSS